MRIFKKLDIFILKDYLLLFAGTFFICLFIFMMQFMWRYLEELVGRGLSMDVLMKFFYYSGLTLVPMSLPMAVLLASLIPGVEHEAEVARAGDSRGRLLQ